MHSLMIHTDYEGSGHCRKKLRKLRCIFSMSSTTVFLMYILRKYPFPCTYIICMPRYIWGRPPPLRPEKKIKKNNLLSLPHAS